MTKCAGSRSALRDVAWWNWALGCKSAEGRGRHWQKGWKWWRGKCLWSCLCWHIKQGQDLASNPSPHPLTIMGLAYINQHSPRTTYRQGLDHTTYQDCSQWAVWMQSPCFGRRRKLRSVDASHAGTFAGPENRPWLVQFYNIVLTPGSCQTYRIIWGMQLFWAEGQILDKVSDTGESTQMFTDSVFTCKTVGACSKSFSEDVSLVILTSVNSSLVYFLICCNLLVQILYIFQGHSY